MFSRVFAPVFVCAAALGAGADVLFLTNGDRLSGTIVEVNAEGVFIDTPYAGEVGVAMDTIDHAETDAGDALALEPMVLEAAAEDTPADAAPAAAAAPAKARERDNWTGSVEAGATFRTGNTDTTNAHLEAKAVRERERHILTLRAYTAYGESNDLLNTRQYRGEARWQHYPRERLYWYLQSAAEHDAGRKLDLRLNAAIGAGYDVIDRERQKLSIDGGFDFTYEEWSAFTPEGRASTREARRAAAQASLLGILPGLADGSTPLTTANITSLAESIRAYLNPLPEARRTDDFVSLRLGLNWEKHLFKNSVLTEELILFPQITDFGEFRATSDLALTTPLSEHLSMKINLKTEYHSQADETGADEWDNNLITSLRYEF